MCSTVATENSVEAYLIRRASFSKRSALSPLANGEPTRA